MMTSKIDLILHPVRMRVIQILFGRKLTTREVAKSIADVPPATLYRHVGLLWRGGIISVVDEKRVRGAIERVYTVARENIAITREDLRPLSRDDHLRMFMAFIASVIGGFERYLDQSGLDLAADGAGYRQATLYLDDRELERLGAALVGPVTRALAQRPGPGRRQFTVSTIVVPESSIGRRKRSASGRARRD